MNERAGGMVAAGTAGGTFSCGKRSVNKITVAAAGVIGCGETGSCSVESEG